jgi:hypothetical protein
MNPKTTALVLAMFTILCALPAAGVVPAAIAQEGTSLDEDLVGGIISNVLDGSDDEQNGDSDAEIDQDSTDTATVNPNQEDQTVDQEDVAFCFEPDLPREFFCFDTREECEIAEELVGSAEELLGSVISGCEGFETPPPGALPCSVPEGGQIIRCEVTQIPR